MTNWGTWVEDSGEVALRTNNTINALLDWAWKTNTGEIQRGHVRDAVRQVAGIQGRATIREYVERVLREGPFEPAPDAEAFYRVDWAATAREVQDGP